MVRTHRLCSKFTFTGRCSLQCPGPDREITHCTTVFSCSKASGLHESGRIETARVCVCDITRMQRNMRSELRGCSCNSLSESESLDSMIALRTAAGTSVVMLIDAHEPVRTATPTQLLLCFGSWRGCLKHSFAKKWNIAFWTFRPWHGLSTSTLS